MQRNRFPFLAIVILLLFAGGCSTTRVVTITSKPADATIKIDGIDRGRGPITQAFVFEDDRQTHRVTANRLGFREQTIELTKDYSNGTLLFEMKPFTRKINIQVRPVPAIVTIDGKPMSAEPIKATTKELEFTVDARNNWTRYVLRAEREGFEPAEADVTFQDREPIYTLNLEPMKKDLSINTTPPGATVFLDDQEIGNTPVKVSAQPFRYDVETNQYEPRKLRATKPGYDPREIEIGWDEGKSDYELQLEPKSKIIHVATDPPGATVTIGGVELKREPNGSSAGKLTFKPVDEQGSPPIFTATATKKTAESEWEPKQFTIGWDGGRTDYSVKLKEITIVPLPLLTVDLQRGDNGWETLPKVVQTIASKDVTEGQHRQPPVRLARLPRGTSIDSIAVSPDGRYLLYNVLYGTDRASFRSQMFAIRTDGSGGTDMVSDGKSLDLMPTYTPGGDQIVFSSDRGGNRLSIWAIAANGAPIVTSLTNGDTNDLWPSVDSDPKPRLFYQAMIDKRPDPRVFSTLIGTSFRTDLTPNGGMQPRINPKNDAVVFCNANEKTGKRDIFRVSDRGGAPENLTNSPETEEYDANWSPDGGRIVFVSDRGVDADNRPNADLWIIDLAKRDPVQITFNASQDDRPVWDPLGNAIYFRSNRGGEWGIWKVSTK